ncbi:CLUMA_CG020191, isoform A [Clunio marinus]|uniref:CLUMA_CG020191, isoform A n=1 Tax=Clunio marinus TaxID=568069 RepID=A0A1J1J476_9DIPT|nr:CLUMA_CG020191, isoform A [Clunio marinus]
MLNNLIQSFNESEENLNSHLMKHAIPGEKCLRKCSLNDQKVCYFNFTLKTYQILGGSCGECSNGIADDCFNERCVIADGIGRSYLSLNFELPAPKIEVCKSDILVIDLHNDAEGLSTSLHWHGMRQFGTQFMDGVPYLTQCPIPYGESFRYSFYALDEGTHFYHSHAGNQKADGVYGALIVRSVNSDNPNIQTYDYDLSEHTILMADWMHALSEDHMPGLTRRSSLSQIFLCTHSYQQSTNSSSFAPLMIFHVEADKKYRFRLINAGLNVCPFLLQIEDHNMTIIATEVSYVKPQVINSLYFMSGERYDFVINTHHRPLRDYWIRFRQLNPCVQELEGFAILRYHKNNKLLDKLNKKQSVEFNDRIPPGYNEEYPNGTLLNSPLPGKKYMPITHLDDYRLDDKISEGAADKTNFIFFDTPGIPNSFLYTNPMLKKYMFTTSGNGMSFIGSANNISFAYPSFPLLLEPNRVHDEFFCDEKSIKNESCFQYDTKTICRCIHRIKFKLNSIAELIVVNIYDKITHPIHLHGHKFHIMDSGLLRENITEEDVRNGAIPLKNKYKRPPYKDTVVLPYPGYVRLRFRANNPGYWLLHCHFDWHLVIGMALMIQVGEITDMRQPPENFPRCHNYMPDGIV